jgi:hypothetical protein
MKKDIAEVLGMLFGGFLFVAAYSAIMPLAIIWSLNELFHLGIPFTFWTWLATFLLGGVLRIKIK